MQQVLGVAIGVVLVCLLLSIFASHIQEIGVTFTARRAATLEQALRAMLGDNALCQKFYEHPLIQNISFPASRFLWIRSKASVTARPTYVASKLFSRVLAAVIADVHMPTGNAGAAAPASALQPAPALQTAQGATIREVDVTASATDAGKAGGTGQQMQTVVASAKVQPAAAPNFAKLIDALPAGTPLKQRLETIVLGIEHDANTCNLAIEEWYDGTMERVNGLYKRDTQWILMGLGMLLAILCNANLFSVTAMLWKSQAARDQVAAVSQLYVCPAGSTCSVNDMDHYRQARDSVANDLDTVPIGWKLSNTKLYWAKVFHGDKTMVAAGEHLRWIAGDWSYKFFGWLLTAIAVSLGAPFWFDMLNKIVNMRMAGVKPATAGSKSKG
jgi:hypothetical protein